MDDIRDYLFFLCIAALFAAAGASIFKLWTDKPRQEPSNPIITTEDNKTWLK